MGEPQIPGFIAKLWDMVNDGKYDDLIKWCEDGTRFVIKDSTKFCTELLPIYYKHNNMASFVRQLNKYGFKKVAGLDSLSLKNDKSDLEFFHPHFLRDFPSLLQDIKRKVTLNNKDVTYPGVMVQLAQEVQQLQQKQNIFDAKMRAMKNENSALWREHSILRHKHQNLQKLLNKLIQFILTLVQQTRGLNIKRVNLPLMIKDRSTDSCATLKHRARSRESNTSNSLADGEITEIIVPDILEENETNFTPGFNENCTSPPTIQVVDNDPPEDSPTSFVAVPLQEISPAIVYGKYAELPKKAEPKSLLASNKINTRKRLADGSVVNAPKKIIIKPTPSSTPSTIIRRPIYVKKKALQPVYQSIQPAKKPKGTIAEINAEPNVINKIVNSLTNNEESRRQEGNANNAVVDDFTSIPLIQSPSGTQLSPGLAVDGNKVDEANGQNKTDVKSDNSLEPLQRDIDNHISTIQSDLDVLKDLLQSEGISLDASSLLGLFNDDPLLLNMPDTLGLPTEPSSSGNELISYNTPSLLDIVDDIEENDNSDFLLPLPSPTLNTPMYDISSPSSSKRMK